MKKLLGSILVLASTCTYAQSSFMITNKTSPKEQISIKCDNRQCQSVTAAFLINGEVMKTEKIDSETLQHIAESKQKLRFDCKAGVREYDGWTEYLAGAEFGLTREFTKGAKQRWDRGYEVESALQYVFLGTLGVALDVVITPLTAPFLPFKCIHSNSQYSRKEIKEAKKVLKMLRKGKTELKERRFDKAYSYLF